jgi:uncharacterized protein YdhG (YjbR/CyaY superfamily)
MREGPKATSISNYIAKFPPPTRRVLTRVRTVIRKALPGAEEAISYGIPAFKIRGRIVVYFAGWKEHYSIYPFNKRLEAALKDEVAAYEKSGRGTIRFPLDAPVPVKLLTAIARFRAREVVEAQAARKKAAVKKA